MVTLEQSYAECRRLNRRYGTTYYWSTYVLPRVKRHHVHALYGFCRRADDIVDDLGPQPVEERAAALRAFGDQFFVDVEAGRSDDLVLKAVVHTVCAFGIDPGCFRRFLHSMEMDLSVATYETFDDLRLYTDGSAAVIGEMMLPILGPLDDAAIGPARDLGDAFQLTNFLRDIDEDLDRERVYLPQSDIGRFDAQQAFADRRVTPGFVELMRFEIDRTRRLYESAAQGFAHLPPTSARCIRVAHDLYGRILDVIEANGYDVFTSRARIPTWQKAALASRALVSARQRT